MAPIKEKLTLIRIKKKLRKGDEIVSLMSRKRRGKPLARVISLL